VAAVVAAEAGRTLLRPAEAAAGSILRPEEEAAGAESIPLPGAAVVVASPTSSSSLMRLYSRPALVSSR
jgi:hypothetical protein